MIRHLAGDGPEAAIRGRLGAERVTLTARANLHHRAVELHVRAFGRPMVITIERQAGLALAMQLINADMKLN